MKSPKHSASDRCPCRSESESIPYAACCERYHHASDLGAASLEDPRDLVRARFSAFALGLLPFIRATESKSRSAVSALDPRTRYKHLELLDQSAQAAADEQPRVLFAVDVFSRGADVSFVELSSFAIEEGRLVYVTGVTARKHLGERLAPLSIADFEARIRS